MCDYSLECYKSRAAEDNEDLVLRRFGTGSHGFVGVDDQFADLNGGVLTEACAVCCEPGVEMEIELLGVYSTMDRETTKCENEAFTGEPVKVTFYTRPRATVSMWSHLDGLVLPSGRFLSLQWIMDGTKATVTKALPAEIADAAKAEMAFDPEIQVAEIDPGYAHVEAYDLIG